MSKEHYETYVTRIGRRRGKAYAERKPLNVPWDLARGTYEKLSNLQLREALNDLQEEAARRELPDEPATQQCSYDPLASQIRRPS